MLGIADIVVHDFHTIHNFSIVRAVFAGFPGCIVTITTVCCVTFIRPFVTVKTNHSNCIDFLSFPTQADNKVTDLVLKVHLNR